MTNLHTAFLGLPGGAEWILAFAVLLLLFGKRVPDVARSLGRGIVEFKKGVQGIEEEVEQAASTPPPRTQARDKALPAGKGNEA